MLFTSQPLPRGPINQYRRVPSRCIYIALYILIDVCINNAGPSFSLKCYAKMQTFSFSTMVLVIRMSWEELWRDKLQTCQASVHVFCFKSVSWRPPLAVGTPLFRLAPALGEAGLLLCLGWSTEGPLGPVLGLIDQAGSPCHVCCATSDSLQPHYLVLRLPLSLSYLNQGTRSKAAAPHWAADFQLLSRDTQWGPP